MASQPQSQDLNLRSPTPDPSPNPGCPGSLLLSNMLHKIWVESMGNVTCLSFALVQLSPSGRLPYWDVCAHLEWFQQRIQEEPKFWKFAPGWGGDHSHPTVSHALPPFSTGRGSHTMASHSSLSSWGNRGPERRGELPGDLIAELVRPYTEDRSTFPLNPMSKQPHP